MLSQVQEYTCQYTDQIKKKHKVWHDGNLRYIESNNKFILYSENSRTQLANKVVPNAKEANKYLDPDGFGDSEHRIFGSYLVIVEELVKEYEKEVQIGTVTKHTRDNSSVRLHAARKSGCITNTAKSTLPVSRLSFSVKSNTVNKEHIGSGCQAKPNIELKNLTLKFNKPFKRPAPFGEKSLEPEICPKVKSDEYWPTNMLENRSKRNEIKPCGTSLQEIKENSNARRTLNRPSRYRGRVIEEIPGRSRIKAVSHSTIFL